MFYIEHGIVRIIYLKQFRHRLAIDTDPATNRTRG
jgi:hypothetical protein